VTLPDKIQNVNDIRAFFVHLIKEENLNFHPDTSFDEYIRYADGSPTYTPDECCVRELLLDQSFAVAGDGIYDIGQDELLQERILPSTTETASNF